MRIKKERKVGMAAVDKPVLVEAKVVAASQQTSLVDFITEAVKDKIKKTKK